MATSFSNFGTMFSMAGASLFLPFLPLLPKQILLMNLMTNMPEMAIATDNVDAELVEKPRRWNIKFIRKFMIVYFWFIKYDLFDYVTFGVYFVHITFFYRLNLGQLGLLNTWSNCYFHYCHGYNRSRKPLFKSRTGKTSFY